VNLPETRHQYRLLACDLDGTLIGADTTISMRLQKALSAVHARGLSVTLATGRAFPATLPFARLINVSIPLICYQGGLIKDPMDGQQLFRATMERSMVLQVVKLASARGWHLIVYIDDDVFLRERCYSHKFYLDLLGARLHQVDDLATIIKQYPRDPAKFILVADKAKADLIQTEMNTRFGQQMGIIRSHDLFVEGNPLGVSKGDALRRLAEHLNIPQNQVMAIGDQENDASMLAWSGLGVAMGSGSESAKAAADWIAPPFEDEGAVTAIERFLLNQ
jgi:Cof subfamily protein (haloacid dehalogenase superfamily)